MTPRVPLRPSLAQPPIGFNAPPDSASPNWPICAGLLLAMVALASGAAVGVYDHLVAAFAPPTDRYVVSFKIEARYCEEHHPFNSCGGLSPAARIADGARGLPAPRAPSAVSMQEARR